MLRILVVEDDPTCRELLVELIQESQRQVEAYGDSLQAAHRIEQVKFDAIMLDLGMPGLNGLEVAKIVRNSPLNKTTPIVVVTGSEDPDSLQLSFSAGATYFLRKPVTGGDLGVVLANLVARKNQNRRRFTRVPLHTDVTCTAKGTILHGMAWNISQSGMQLEVPGLEMGTNLTVSFTLPDMVNAVGVEGMVVWVREERQGINFTDVGIEAQDRIRNFVNRAGYG